MDKKEKTAKALGIVSFVLSILGWLCHNKQLINSHFCRGASKLPYKLELDLPIFLKSHVELLFHLPRYALLILTSISIFY